MSQSGATRYMLKWIMKPLKRFLSALFIPPKWLTDIQTDRHNEVKCAIERSVRWKISNDALWQIGGTQNFVYWVKRVNDFVKRNSQTCRSFSSNEGHAFICYYCIFWLGRYKTNVTLMNWHSEWYFFSVFRGWGGGVWEERQLHSFQQCHEIFAKSTLC